MKTDIISSKNIRKYCCKDEDDFFKALKKIDKNEYKFLIVVSKEKKTIGTITDGDIRRSLLKLSSKDLKVGKIMNKNFSYGLNSHSEENNINLAVKFLKKNHLNSSFFPVVDKNKLLKKILVISKDISELNILILAGGKGSRLGKLTANTPKPLLKIKNKSILELILNSVKKIPKNKIYISLNYKKEKIIKKINSLKIKNIVFLNENKPLGTAGSLSLIRDHKNDLIVINGDIITNLNFESFIEYFYDKDYDALIASALIPKKIDFGVLETENDNLVNIKEKPILNINIASGIYLFKSKVLKNFNKVNRIDMPEFLNKLLKNNYNVGVFPIYEKWIDIGTPKSLKNERK